MVESAACKSAVRPKLGAVSRGVDSRSPAWPAHRVQSAHEMTSLYNAARRTYRPKRRTVVPNRAGLAGCETPSAESETQGRVKMVDGDDGG